MLVLEAMHAVMAEVTSVSKDDQFNGGQTRYQYRGVDRVVKAISGSMRKHKLVILPVCSAIPDYIPCTTAQGKPASMVRVLVTYRIYGPEGDSVEVTTPGEAMDSSDKAVSKAMSVAWRTALIQAFFLPTDEPDPDSENIELGRPHAVAQTSPAVQRLQKYDEQNADWNAAIEAAVGDYDALGRLFMEAKAQKAPEEILNKIWAEGQKVKPS